MLALERNLRKEPWKYLVHAGPKFLFLRAPGFLIQSSQYHSHFVQISTCCFACTTSCSPHDALINKSWMSLCSKTITSVTRDLKILQVIYHEMNTYLYILMKTVYNSLSNNNENALEKSLEVNGFTHSKNEDISERSLWDYFDGVLTAWNNFIFINLE